MLTSVKSFFRSQRDANGQKVDQVINRLAMQNNTDTYAWSYIQDEASYENTVTGQRVYLSGSSKKAA